MAKVFKVKAQFVADDKASPTITKLKKSQADLGKEVDRLGAAFRKGDISVDNYTKALDDAEKEQKKLDKALRASSKEVETTGSKISKFASGVKANFLAIVAASAAVVGAFKLIEDAAEKTAQRKAFENAVEDADAFLAKLREVSNAQIANADLILATNRALKLGIQADAIPELLDNAARASVLLGTDVTKAFDDITLGVARGSRQILDNLGIIVDVEAANKEYAAALGKTVEALTAQERTIATTNAVLKTSSGLTGNFSDQQNKLTRTSNQLKASFKNLAVAVGEAAGKLVEMVAPSDDLAVSLQATADVLPDTIQGMKDYAAALAEAKGEQSALDDILGGLANKFTSLGTGIAATEADFKRFTDQFEPITGTFSDFAKEVVKTTAAEAELDKTLIKLNQRWNDQQQQLAALIGLQNDYSEATQDAADAAARQAQLTAAGATALEALAAALGEATSVALQGEILRIEENLIAVRDAGILTRGEFERLSDVAVEKIESLRERVQNLKDGMGDLGPVLDVVTGGFSRGATAADAEATSIGRLIAGVVELTTRTEALTQAEQRRLNLAGGLVDSSGRPLTQAQQRRQRLGGRGTFTDFDIPGGTFTTVKQIELDSNGDIIP